MLSLVVLPVLLPCVIIILKLLVPILDSDWLIGVVNRTIYHTLKLLVVVQNDFNVAMLVTVLE